MNPKSPFASKTLWVNVLGGLVTVIASYGGYLPPKYTPLVMAVGAIANIVLRLLTNQPVTLTGK